MPISAIIPAYNAERYIRHTLESLLHQSLMPAEILVVDDGSTDHTRSMTQEMAHSHSIIRLISQENRGETRARLTGLEAAKGDYIYFLDSDDEVVPDALERLSVGFEAHPNAVVCYAGHANIDSAGAILYQTAYRADYSGDVLDEILLHNFLSIGTGLIRKAALKRAAFDHRFTIGGDVVMWTLLALEGNFYPIEGPPVLRRRIHDTNISSSALNEPSLYDAYIHWLFSYQPLLEHLGSEKLNRAKTRRQAGSHSYAARQALLQRQFALAMQQARTAIRLEPLNHRLWALYLCAAFRFTPSWIARRLGA